MDLKSTITLNNGVKMPWIGLGTFKMPDDQIVIDAVRNAIDFGYRHIDTAAIYKNEEGVGKGVKESSVKREEIFITSKLWPSEFTYDKAMRSFEASLKKLDTDYLDLFLLHWPRPYEQNAEAWKALEKLYDEKLIRAIGVSNFNPHHLEALMTKANVKPVIDQVEYHMGFQQEELHDFCKKNEIQLEAWAPLMQGRVFEIELLKDIAKKYNKSISQLVVKWVLQKEVIVIPKSTKKERIIENVDVFDFEITGEDMIRIDTLNKKHRLFTDPETAGF